MAIISSETLIIFIASILVATSVAGVLTTGVERMSNAMDDRSIDVSHEISTDIQVISDPGSGAVYDSGTDELTLLVKNTGSRTLSTDPNTIDVLVDGEYESNVQTSLVGGDSEWRPGAVLEVTVTTPALSGSTRAVVIVDGNRDTFEFRA